MDRYEQDSSGSPGGVEGDLLRIDTAARCLWETEAVEKEKKRKVFLGAQRGVDESEQKIDESWIPMLGQQAFHICACCYSSYSLSSAVVRFWRHTHPSNIHPVGMCTGLRCTLPPLINVFQICYIIRHLCGIKVVWLWNLNMTNSLQIWSKLHKRLVLSWSKTNLHHESSYTWCLHSYFVELRSCVCECLTDRDCFKF